MKKLIAIILAVLLFATACGTFDEDSAKNNPTESTSTLESTSSTESSESTGIEITEHVHYYDAVVTKKATCKKVGKMTYTCSCGDSYTEEIKKSDHEYSKKVVEPTTSKKGYTQYTCSVCGHSYKDDYTDKLSKEQYVWIPSSGKKYHSTSSCSGMKNPSKVTKSKAEQMGYTPCKKCW